jgi:hypothetical protein
LATLESFANLGEGFVSGKGLGEEGDIEVSQPVLRQHLGGMSRHEQDPLVRPSLPNVVGQLDAIQPGHDDIDHEEIDTTPGDVQGTQSFLTVLGLQDTVARLAEDAIRHPASIRLVVNYKDGGGGLGKWERQGKTSRSGGTSTAPPP